MSDKPCSRDPECSEGHEGMVFRSGCWRDPEKRRTRARSYAASEKGREQHRVRMRRYRATPRGQWARWCQQRRRQEKRDAAARERIVAQLEELRKDEELILNGG